jgi:hypothetical protein
MIAPFTGDRKFSLLFAAGKSVCLALRMSAKPAWSSTNLGGGVKITFSVDNKDIGAAGHVLQVPTSRYGDGSQAVEFETNCTAV